MAEKSYAIEQDLREAQAMVDALERYVRGNELYGSVGRGGFFSNANMPMLTIGGLAMRVRRLKALAGLGRLSDEQSAQVERIAEAQIAVRKGWTVHYDAKMKREANSRLDAMKMFFEECASSLRLCARVYPQEVLRRTTVEELFIHMEALGVAHDDEIAKARATDDRLRRFLAPAEFVWVQELAPVYDERRFWWMYRFPPVNTRD